MKSSAVVTECVKMLKYIVATYCGVLTPQQLAKSLEFEQTP